MAHIVLTFDNNKLASALYGQFDENLARLEQKLGVDIRSRGNQLTIKGNAAARRAGPARTRPPLQHPAERRRDRPVRCRRRRAHGDRRRRSADLADAGAKGPHGCRTDRHPQAHHLCPLAQSGRLYAGAGAVRDWCSVSVRPGPARPISRSRMRRCCSSAAWSSASSCRGRPSRPASGSASCPAT